MAVIPLNAATTTINGEAYSTFTIPALPTPVTGTPSTRGHIVTGVLLRRELENDNSVKVRPTNVTATIGSVPATAGAGEPDVIILHNGPAGGFNQKVQLAPGTYAVNGVIQGILTEEIIA